MEAKAAEVRPGAISAIWGGNCRTETGVGEGDEVGGATRCGATAGPLAGCFSREEEDEALEGRDGDRGREWEVGDRDLAEE